MICLFRIIGAVTSLISISHPSSGLTICYDIMNSFGLSAIVYTALGLLDRVNDGMAGFGLPRRFFQLLHLPGVAGLVLSILGSTNIFSNDSSDHSTGFTELKAAIILFLVVFIADVFVTAKSFLKMSRVRSEDRRLLFAVAVTLPFMAVRMLFSLLCVFAEEPKYFSSWSLDFVPILVHGFMGVLVEAIIVSIFIAAGLTTSPAPKPVAREGKVVYNVEARSV